MGTLFDGVNRSGALRFVGASHFRQRIVCATLAGKSIIISDIRSTDKEPGLRDFEASFLRMIEKVTNGCEIVINETGEHFSVFA
jgi:RNA 3'-terminal phosphate cyclase-like protein